VLDAEEDAAQQDGTGGVPVFDVDLEQAAERAAAVARPMPLAPPVITATFPVSRPRRTAGSADALRALLVGIATSNAPSSARPP
jgi:hypothetical protein